MKCRNMLTLPTASRVITGQIKRLMRPQIAPNLSRLATALHDHGDKNDLMVSRLAFSEKPKLNFKGQLDPEDRYQMPTL